MGEAISGVVGDVGGTHARFAVAEMRDGKAHIREPEVLLAKDYPSGEAALEAFLGKVKGARPKLAVIAAAGPINDGEVVFTNNKSFGFSEARMKKACGFTAARLINDFAGQALAIDQFTSHDLRLIGPRVHGDKAGTAAIIGPGTGFGAAALVDDGHAKTVLTGEGGHAGFAAEDETESEIIRQLSKKFGRTSIERVLSGPGLFNLYQCLGAMQKKDAVLTAPDEVTRHGLAGDPLAREALSRFCAILGSVAGDFALVMGARRGVYISGGIAPDIFDFLKASDFRRRFEAKGRFQSYLAAIPTHVVVQPHAALIGAATRLPDLARPE